MPRIPQRPLNIFEHSIVLFNILSSNNTLHLATQPSPDSLPSPSHCPVLTSVLKAVSIPITRKVQDHSNSVLFWLVLIVSYLVPYVNHKDLLFLDLVFYS